MRRALRLICFFALIVGFETDSWSKPPTPSPTITSHEPEGQPTATKAPASEEQRGTEDLPFVIKIMPTPKAQDETENAATEKNEQTSPEWWLVRLTAILAVIAFVQTIVFGWQGVQLRSTVKATQAAERARVYVAVKWTGLPTDNPEVVMPFVHIKIRNHGKTAAPLKQLRIYLDVVSQYPNALLEFPGSEQEIPAGMVIHGDGGEWETHASKTIPIKDWENILGSNLMLICLGKIAYLDIYGERHETGFCWQIYPIEGGTGGIRWDISPNYKLNYQT